MKLLVSNVGSTSLKFKLFVMPEEKVLCTAKVERVGSTDNAIFSYKNEITGQTFNADGLAVPTYKDGIQLFNSYMTGKEMGVIESISEIEAVGFKSTVSKGYYGIHRLTPEVIQGMKDFINIAPAHNGPYLEAIGQFEEALPGVPMVGVYETAFHTTIPEEKRMYSVPYEWFEKYGIQKLGYHGASHSYVIERLKDFADAKKVISCHLGGSCSLCAMVDGKSLDSSFGMSLQTGVLHANRCGDIDPYIIPFLLSEGMPIEEILKGLDKNGGLLGISGVSNDLRLVEEAAEQGNKRAQLAVDMFVNDIVKYAGMFYAEMGGLDAIIFTGGIGENSKTVRQRVCQALCHMGLDIDLEKNDTVREGLLNTESSKVKIAVLPTNEELGVARKTYADIMNN